VATGIALAMRYKGTNGVTFSYFGDGATSRGDWHEGVNFASVQKLPVVYICNNNQYAYSTPLDLQMGCKHVADKGPAYGIPAEIVDGNDVFAVYEATRRAAAHARSGLGPYLLECKTFRMTGHSAGDAAKYVPKQLFEEWEKQDPIVRAERRMLDEGWASQSAIDQAHAAVKQEVDDAVAWAEQSPYPDPATLEQDVFEGQ
jgi:pyruvate dehydrogenase E1 component alpha subunit